MDQKEQDIHDLSILLGNIRYATKTLTLRSPYSFTSAKFRAHVRKILSHIKICQELIDNDEALL